MEWGQMGISVDGRGHGLPKGCTGSIQVTGVWQECQISMARSHVCRETGRLNVYGKPPDFYMLPKLN